MLNASKNKNEQVHEKGKKAAYQMPRFLLAPSSSFPFFIFKGPLRGENSLIRPIKLRHFAAPLNGGMGPFAF